MILLLLLLLLAMLMMLRILRELFATRVMRFLVFPLGGRLGSDHLKGLPGWKWWRRRVGVGTIPGALLVLRLQKLVPNERRDGRDVAKPPPGLTRQLANLSRLPGILTNDRRCCCARCYCWSLFPPWESADR